jgi:hemoglobin-like flavoprotein
VKKEGSNKMSGPLPAELFEKLKTLVNFKDEDIANLKALQPIVEKHGQAITDAFYDKLSTNPETAKMIEGRVDALKKTHKAWMQSLVAGDYGQAYVESRWRIGMAHVRVGLDPFWVEGVMSFIRTAMEQALAKEIASPAELAAKHAAFTKVCDLDLMVINLSYAEDRLERLTAFTGMKRGLIENIIRLPKK